MDYQVRQRINAVRNGQTDTLDLSHLGLTQLPDEVFTLSPLRVLRVCNILYSSSQPLIDLMRKKPLGNYHDLLNELEEDEHNRQQELRIPRQLMSLDNRIGKLRSLQTLDLGYNQLTHLPDALGTLPRLRRLMLNNNNLIDVPASLAQLRHLELLALQNNPLRSTPTFPQLDRFEPYRAHFRQQKTEAVRAKDFAVAAWLRQKECSYGLTL